MLYLDVRSPTKLYSWQAPVSLTWLHPTGACLQIHGQQLSHTIIRSHHAPPLQARVPSDKTPLPPRPFSRTASPLVCTRCPCTSDPWCQTCLELPQPLSRSRVAPPPPLVPSAGLCNTRGRTSTSFHTLFPEKAWLRASSARSGWRARISHDIPMSQPQREHAANKSEI